MSEPNLTNVWRSSPALSDLLRRVNALRFYRPPQMGSKPWQAQISNPSSRDHCIIYVRAEPGVLEVQLSLLNTQMGLFDTDGLPNVAWELVTAWEEMPKQYATTNSMSNGGPLTGVRTR